MESSQPNILFLISDQHRWDFFGAHGNGITHTPNLERLAASGVRFHRAFCNAPLCCPSRAALASGRYGVNSGCFLNLHRLPPGTPSFVSQLRQAGYRTAVVGKTHMEIHAYNSDLTSPEHQEFMDSLGWDETCEVSGNSMLKTGIRCAYSEFLRDQGRLRDVVRFYESWGGETDEKIRRQKVFHSHPWPLPEEFQESAFIANRAMDWLRDHSGQQPFFLHVGFAGPHCPIEPNPRHLAQYDPALESEPWDRKDFPDWLRQGRMGYRAMITQIDDYIGQLLDVLEAQGRLDNTVVVYTSDHGEMAGDRDLFQKGFFFDPSVRVPLILRGPGIEPDRESEAMVELIDLGRTCCELAGTETHAFDQGRSLVPLLQGQTKTHRDTVYAEMGCDRMLFDGRYKLHWGDPGLDQRDLGIQHLNRPVNIPPSPSRIYDLENDPQESNDLNANASLRAEMIEKLLIRTNENVQSRPDLPRGPRQPLVSAEMSE